MSSNMINIDSCGESDPLIKSFGSHNLSVCCINEFDYLLKCNSRFYKALSISSNLLMDLCSLSQIPNLLFQEHFFLLTFLILLTIWFRLLIGMDYSFWIFILLILNINRNRWWSSNKGVRWWENTLWILRLSVFSFPPVIQDSKFWVI